MNEAKPFASLSSTLLARKGQAKPAMRPQGFHMTHDASFQIDPYQPQDQDDLGWNDMGEDAPVEAETPVVVQQMEALAAAVAAAAEFAVPASESGTPARRGTKGGKDVRSALQEGRKAAFTLRLDQYRHLRLRLACMLESRSAQALVLEALDRFLADQPGIEDLARRATRN